MSGRYLMRHAVRRDLADFVAAAVATVVTEDEGLWPVPRGARRAYRIRCLLTRSRFARSHGVVFAYVTERPAPARPRTSSAALLAVLPALGPVCGGDEVDVASGR